MVKSLFKKTFADFRSQCMMFRSCIALRPLTIWIKMHQMSVSFICDASY